MQILPQDELVALMRGVVNLWGSPLVVPRLLWDRILMLAGMGHQLLS